MHVNVLPEDREHSAQVAKLLCIGSDADTVLILGDGTSSVRLSAIRFDPLNSRKKRYGGVPFPVSVAYGRSEDSLSAIASTRSVDLVLGNERWASLRGPSALPVAELAYVMRQCGLQPRFQAEDVRNYYESLLRLREEINMFQAQLRMPPISRIHELTRLFRLHGHLFGQSELAEEYCAEREFSRLSRMVDHLALSYEGRNRGKIPDSLTKSLFWAGRCNVFACPDGGSRRVRLVDLYGETVLEAVPRQRALFGFLHRNMEREFRAAFVTVLPDGARKPVSKLVIAPV